jgi:hypothetical protein
LTQKNNDGKLSNGWYKKKQLNDSTRSGAWTSCLMEQNRRESAGQLLKQKSTTHHATLFTQIIDVNCKKRTKLTRVASTVTAACALLCKGLDVWLADLTYMKHDFFPKTSFSLSVFSHAAG